MPSTCVAFQQDKFPVTPQVAALRVDAQSRCTQIANIDTPYKLRKHKHWQP